MKFSQRTLLKLKNKNKKVKSKSSREQIKGTINKPRLSVYRSNENIYAQIIDDTSSKTLISYSTLDRSIKFSFSTSLATTNPEINDGGTPGPGTVNCPVNSKFLILDNYTTLYNFWKNKGLATNILSLYILRITINLTHFMTGFKNFIHAFKILFLGLSGLFIPGISLAQTAGTAITLGGKTIHTVGKQIVMQDICIALLAMFGWDRADLARQIRQR